MRAGSLVVAERERHVVRPAACARVLRRRGRLDGEREEDELEAALARPTDGAVARRLEPELRAEPRELDGCLDARVVEEEVVLLARPERREDEPRVPDRRRARWRGRRRRCGGGGRGGGGGVRAAGGGVGLLRQMRIDDANEELARRVDGRFGRHAHVAVAAPAQRAHKWPLVARRVGLVQPRPSCAAAPHIAAPSSAVVSAGVGGVVGGRGGNRGTAVGPAALRPAPLCQRLQLDELPLEPDILQDERASARARAQNALEWQATCDLDGDGERGRSILPCDAHE